MMSCFPEGGFSNLTDLTDLYNLDMVGALPAFGRSRAVHCYGAAKAAHRKAGPCLSLDQFAESGFLGQQLAQGHRDADAARLPLLYGSAFRAERVERTDEPVPFDVAQCG